MTCPTSCRESDCDLTYAEHLRGGHLFTPSTTPTRGGGAHAEAERKRTKKWEKDMPAYRRLRDQGYQPPQIDGCAFREREATTRFEIEHRKVTVDHDDTR